MMGQNKLPIIETNVGKLVKLDVKREIIDVTGSFEENPAWHYICPSCGDILSCNNLPKGKFVKWGYYSDGEQYPILSYHCKKCWQRIPLSEYEKSVRPSTTRKYIGGRYDVRGFFESYQFSSSIHQYGTTCILKRGRKPLGIIIGVTVNPIGTLDKVESEVHLNNYGIKKIKALLKDERII